MTPGHRTAINTAVLADAEWAVGQMTLARRGAAPSTAAKIRTVATPRPGKRPRTRAAARLSKSPPQREQKSAAVATGSRGNLMASGMRTAPTRDTGWLISRRTDAHRRSLDEPKIGR